MDTPRIAGFWLDVFSPVIWYSHFIAFDPSSNQLLIINTEHYIYICIIMHIYICIIIYIYNHIYIHNHTLFQATTGSSKLATAPNLAHRPTLWAHQSRGGTATGPPKLGHYFHRHPNGWKYKYHVPISKEIWI